MAEKYFSGVSRYYEKCLRNSGQSGLKTKVRYQQPKENNQKEKKRKRNIIWFIPSHSKSVKTNIMGEYSPN